MLISRGEVLAAARKLLRTFASAPEPRRQAQSIYSELAHGDGWTPGEREAIDALGAWLHGLPQLGELKLRCEQLLTALR
jgi:hypothetical protein